MGMPIQIPGARVSRLFAALLIAALAGAAIAAERWQTLDKPVDTTAQQGQVEVVELFWYGCNHCDALEPHLSAWVDEQPDHVTFVRVPAVFSDQWLPLARAYYTIQLLRLDESAHTAMFDAIHRQRRNMNSMDELEKFFVEQGVAADKFKETYGSFAVDTMVRRAVRLTRDYRITGVPAMGIAGKYVTSSSLAGGHDQLLETVSELIAKERAEAAGS